MKKILLLGPNGKMGLATKGALNTAEDLMLVASCARGDDLQTVIDQHQPDVAVDFTLPD